MYNFRTDMAVERTDIYKKVNNIQKDINGIEAENELQKDIEISRVKITNEEGEKALAKPIGNYITLDVKNMKTADDEKIEEIAEAVANELRDVIGKHIKDTEDILVVGLGNLEVTPDSLGPKVISNIEITRHILEYMPKLMPDDTRPVSAISPGVLGTTGIETVEIVKGIVDNIKPKLVIAIDSLCSKNIDRINKSIQISDTGIIPGGGVGNRQEELSVDTLNVPVIGVGIPTVLDAATIVIDTLKACEIDVSENEIVNKMKLNNFNFIVTPKEIDSLIENMSNIVSEGINMLI